MRRALHKKLARENRSQTKGHGRLRRTVGGWVSWQKAIVALEILKSGTNRETRNDSGGLERGVGSE